MVSIVYETSFNFCDLNTKFMLTTKTIWFKLFRIIHFPKQLFKRGCWSKAYFYNLFTTYLVITSLTITWYVLAEQQVLSLG